MIADARPKRLEIGPRCCVRQDGVPKRRWPTRRMAHRYGRQMFGITVHTYQCPVCDHWHNATKGDE